MLVPTSCTISSFEYWSYREKKQVKFLGDGKVMAMAIQLAVVDHYHPSSFVVMGIERSVVSIRWHLIAVEVECVVLLRPLSCKNGG